MSDQASVFGTNRRIRLGFWGLGRGMSFVEMCQALNFDVVAGCDFNPQMRESFQKTCPDALVTDDADEFLDSDIDAVLLATYCPAHAADAIRCLEAGKHVLSEVTSFHTMGEAVELVEAVERTGKVYNLAENYPFTAHQSYLARRWREGLFGEFMYGEGEYVHEVRALAYCYINSEPVVPGDRLHNWRSWQHFHYYNTHSLGPVMVITGLRPTRVVSLPGAIALPGFPREKGGGLGGVAPSLITLSNGAIFRNLMGGMTGDTHTFRYWGTKGSAEITDKLYLRLGAGGDSPRVPVHADWGELTSLAERMPHGGGDFFVLYHFARQILFDEPAPFDIYTAADVTVPGILAYRSSCEGGKPYEVPDFRDKAAREQWRGDHFAQERPDVTRSCFPPTADRTRVERFNTLMRDALAHVKLVRAHADWMKVADDAEDPASIVAAADRVIEAYPAIRDTFREAIDLAEAYPGSEGAALLRDVIELAEAPAVLADGYLDQVKRDRDALKRRVDAAAD